MILVLSSSRGFTLLEVLVAVILVAIGLMSGQRAVSQSINTYTFVRQHQIATWVARNQATLMYLNHNWPNPGNVSFDCSDMGYKFSCQRRVFSTEDDLFREVEFCVFSDNNHMRLACLSAIINRVEGIL
ncbi:MULTISPECIES: type II secretion system minor pseudopilin GspI [Candidatus Ichthyocystis]|uniref:type II secretion system minor pseudopilin GspI n=1 Tax=Candidatus Ichthyocystis TaxID=2929841 RepID=UPI000B81D860|nr:MULTISPECIES: type II secretion system minor pseudopilin GspI [Ichthyocystis]